MRKFPFKSGHLHCRAPPAIAIPREPEMHHSKRGLIRTKEKASTQLMGERFILDELLSFGLIDRGPVENQRLAGFSLEPGNLRPDKRRLVSEILRAVPGPVDQLAMQRAQLIE